jgi:peptidase E
MKKIVFSAFIFLFSAMAGTVFAHQPNLVYLNPQNVQITNPEISRAFYDELTGKPRDYFITSPKQFDFYINLLVPMAENRDGRYSANVYSVNGKTETLIFSTDTLSTSWSEYYEEFGRDYYLKGPEFTKTLPAGSYKIEVFSADNKGKYVLAVGKTESFDAMSILNIYWQLPMLKLTFFKTSVLQFFLTPFGIAGIGAIGAFLILIAIIYFLVGAIKEAIRHSQAKTLLLASNFANMREEVTKLLQKPAYDITVAFISTAAKPEQNLDYLKKDWEIMKEMGFNIEEVDIEGKNESQVYNLISMKDIIFVEGGNTFYLLKAMRSCNFGRIMRKLLKEGKVYIGASAGSIVAGRTIKTASWSGDQNIAKISNLKGLNLVPFDIFVHYTPEYAEIIKKKAPFKWQRKKLKIITDEQAILVQAKEVALIGQGEAVII